MWVKKQDGGMRSGRRISTLGRDEMRPSGDDQAKRLTPS